jgi:hypothetical protein
LVQEDIATIAVIVPADALGRAQAAVEDVARTIDSAFGAGFRVELKMAQARQAGMRRKKHELFNSLLG